MLFERFEDKGLSQYSYAIGCVRAGVVAIVDPRRDVDVYLDFAAASKVRITHVVETHIHADFASGARELAARSGAQYRPSGHDRGEMYEVGVPHNDLCDGEAIELGAARLVARHTPGHTPEHLSFLVYDTVRTREVPQIFLTGDFLFVGSLGRPDLLGEDAKVALANQLFDSARDRIGDLPDGIEVHPGHGAGSMCGAGMSDRPMSTLGFERIANPYLNRAMNREEFVDRILSSAPPFPPYYTRMKRLNAAGPAILNGLPGLEALPAGRVRDLLTHGHVLVDLRDQIAFGAGHVPGAFGIGAGPGLSTWASWVVPYDTPIVLLADDAAVVREAIRSLVRVGLDQVVGYLDGGMPAWTGAGFPVSTLAQVTPEALRDRLARDRALAVLDVRGDAEFADGHIDGAIHIMGGTLKDRVQELRGRGPMAIACGSGYRSTVAASVLERAGFTDLINLTGGMTAWTRSGLPVVR
ncbi:MAG TPA: rhodanese-like domain-containing protein [Vicinamibacterales bacterium]|jgi:hydroxyacylglutathione hydrolase|nr:rhodanese-like domain-containing protein [Vicinamibacterales bacterium]